MALKATPQAGPDAARPESRPVPVLPLGMAVLVIAGLSAALWFGIIRLLRALF